MKPQTFIYYLLFCLLPTTALHAQTNLWLLDLKHQKGKYTFTNPQKINAVEGGYNNQPSFSPDGKRIYFVAGNKDQQTDIYCHNLQTHQTRAFCQTPESEFSPMVTPEGDKISCVRIELDSTQRMWQFPISGDDATCLMPLMRGIGYYLWLAPNELAVDIVRDPNLELQLVNTERVQPKTLVKHAGRCLKAIPDEALKMSYVGKVNESDLHLIELDWINDQSHFIAKLPPLCEDYDWTPKGHVLLGQNGTMQVFNPNHSERGWQAQGAIPAQVGTFYRLAVSPNGKKIALVACEGKKP